MNIKIRQKHTPIQERNLVEEKINKTGSVGWTWILHEVVRIFHHLCEIERMDVHRKRPSLRSSLWPRREISLRIKGRIYHAVEHFILLCGCETWPVRVTTWGPSPSYLKRQLCMPVQAPRPNEKPSFADTTTLTKARSYMYKGDLNRVPSATHRGERTGWKLQASSHRVVSTRYAGYSICAAGTISGK